MVSSFNTKIMDDAVLLANGGTYEYNYWKTFSDLPVYGDMDYSAMVEHAMEWLSENTDSDADAVNAAYAAICDANCRWRDPPRICQNLWTQRLALTTNCICSSPSHQEKLKIFLPHSMIVPAPS